MNSANNNDIFKQLKEREVDRKTIKKVRKVLVAFMEDHPLKRDNDGFFGIFKQAVFRLRLAALAFTILFLVFFSGVSTFAFAQESLPGDALYPVKLFVEEARLRVVLDPSKKTSLKRELFEKRTWELEQTVVKLDSMKEKEGKRSKLDEGVSAALEDAKNKAEELEADEGQWNKDGRDSDFYRASERLRANAKILENVLSDDNLRKGKTGKASEEALKQAKSLVNKIDQELKQPTSLKAEAAKALLEAATSNIKDAEGKISGSKVEGERKKEAENNIKKAKDLLEAAKNDYGDNNLDQTYEKALEAVQQSTITERTLKSVVDSSSLINDSSGQSPKTGGSDAGSNDGNSGSGGGNEPSSGPATPAIDNAGNSGSSGSTGGSSGSSGKDGQ